MKIGNIEQLVPKYENVEIRPDVSIRIAQVPIGFDQETEKELPTPPIPKTLVMGKNNTPVRENGKVVYEPDREDPSYLMQLNEIDGLQTIRMIYHSIKDAPGIQFDTPTTEDKKLFYRNIREEMRLFGFSLADLATLAVAVGRVNAFSEEALEKAKNSLAE